MTFSLSASREPSRLAGRLSSHARYLSCKAINVATAAAQRCGRGSGRRCGAGGNGPSTPARRRHRVKQHGGGLRNGARIGAIVLGQPALGLGEQANPLGIEPYDLEATRLESVDHGDFISTGGFHADAHHLALGEPSGELVVSGGGRCGGHRAGPLLFGTIHRYKVGRCAQRSFRVRENFCRYL
jgi:hypothetical protein